MKWPEEYILELKRSGIEFALCTVVGTKGSVPRETGAKMIVKTDGRISGTIGGGELEKRVINDALKTVQERTPGLFRYDLLHQLNMCCGGTVEIFIEPILKQHRLYIFGAGHVGLALARQAATLEFDVYIIDDRSDVMNEISIEGVSKMKLPHTSALSALPFDKNTFVCILTYSHPVDRDILAHCIQLPLGYLGMIGSRRKVEITRKIFRESGIATETELDRVDMPMGIDIGAEGPEEIAISIIARLIETRKRNSSGVMKAAFTGDSSTVNVSISGPE